MEKLEKALKILLEDLKRKENITNQEDTNSVRIPVGISNRHIHLSKEHTEILFGQNYQLTRLKDLSQLGQYACKETLIICGPKSSVERVRVLGPERNKTQVEVSVGDCRKLGIAPNVRMSGDLSGTSEIVIIGPKGSLRLEEGIIVAQRHIHMNSEYANKFNLKNEELVSIEIEGLRGGTLNNVCVRIDDSFSLECHLDTEEANSVGINPKTSVKIKKNKKK